MTYNYELKETSLGETYIRRSDGATIPLDKANSDYQAYLRHLSGEDEAQSL